MAHEKTPANPTARAIPRRRFIRDSAILTGGAAAGLAHPATAEHGPKPLRLYQVGTEATPAATPVPPAGTPSAQPVTGATLSDHEMAILGAVVDLLIPPSNNGPGAAESGVQTYMQGLLEGYGADAMPMYQAGLKALDAAAQPDGFVAATANTQNAILDRAEKGQLADAPEGFFATLLEHTRQGMFCDPIYGGNINFAGWDLLQYPGIKLFWSVEDQAMDTVVKPEHTSVAAYGGTPID